MFILESEEDILDIFREFELPAHFDVFDFWRAADKIGLMGEDCDLRGTYIWLDEEYYQELLKNPHDLIAEMF